MPAPFEISIDGATLRGEADGFGIPVVFLHAGVADRRMWAAQMDDVVAAGFHVVSYDRRGFGETESPDEPFSYLVDLEGLLDRLDIHAAVLVGCGSGGALALDFAIENPGRTIGLVLIGTGVTGEAPAEQPDEIVDITDALAYAEERGNAEQAARLSAHLWLDGPLEASGRVGGEVRRLFVDMNLALRQQPALTQEETPEAAVEAVPGINTPALLVVGDLDFPETIDRHETLSEELPEAFAIVIEGAAHMASLERPDLFNPLLLEFLEALAGTGNPDE